jgi:hypothetical protein
MDKPCRDCQPMVTFAESEDATCPQCGLRMYLTAAKQVGRYPDPEWEPGGIQGRRRDRG